MKALAVITARGGSKRIPGKNKKEFLGKPILVYSIEAALQSNLFDEVMVSTDDEEIAAIAMKAGAKVPFMRSAQNANDYATTDEVLLEVLEEYEKRGQTFDYLVCLYPTAPFVTPEKLQKALELLVENKAAGAMPVVDFSFPPQRGMSIGEDKRLRYCYPENALKRSQDLEKMYHDCGQFYAYEVKRFRETKGNLEEGYLPIVVSELEVQDIDTLTDWKLAELKYRLWKEQI